MNQLAHRAKAMSLERLELTDKQGRTLAVFGAEHGVPYVARYDGKGRILSWLTFLVDGTPDIRVFDVATDPKADSRRPNGIDKLPVK
jgi:hypothetical protein